MSCIDYREVKKREALEGRAPAFWAVRIVCSGKEMVCREKGSTGRAALTLCEKKRSIAGVKEWFSWQGKALGEPDRGFVGGYNSFTVHFLRLRDDLRRLQGNTQS